LKIAPFRIEQYFAVHEFTAPHLLSSSDAETVSVASVLALEPDAADRLGSLALGYTQSAGAPELRAAASAIYTTTTAQDIVVVSAAEEAIFAAYHALLQPGDHVVVETPCYESALQLARSTGADVSEWRRSADAGWAHDLAALERVMRPNTRLVYINTPHNPTGALIPRKVLDRVIELCAARKAWLFCDEVYRELEHDPAALLPAAVDLYEHAISLGSMSKTYGLPGLRLGWLASQDHRLQALHDHLLKRAERVPQRRRTSPPQRFRRPQPRHRSRKPRVDRCAHGPPRRSSFLGAPKREHDRIHAHRWRRRNRRILREARRRRGRVASARIGVRRADPCPNRFRTDNHARGTASI
jgi:hypothetical protein